MNPFFNLRTCMAAVIALGVLAICGAVAAPEKADLHVFSAVSTPLVSVYERGPPIEIWSPDHASKATVTLLATGDQDGNLFVQINGRLGTGKFPIPYGPNAELLWAPDSAALFVTGDDGGLVGSYVLQVIGRFGGDLRSRDLTPIITRAFGHPVRCFDPEDPNVAGIVWNRSSHKLVAAAEIPGHSNCDSMGGFEVFEIDPYRMAILRRYGQIEAKRRFANV